MLKILSMDVKQSVLEFQRFITLTAVYTVSFYITKAQYTIAKTCVAQTFLIKYMPVSYTHLDVYKRQQ